MVKQRIHLYVVSTKNTQHNVLLTCHMRASFAWGARRGRCPTSTAVHFNTSFVMASLPRTVLSKPCNHVFKQYVITALTVITISIHKGLITAIMIQYIFNLPQIFVQYTIFRREPKFSDPEFEEDLFHDSIRLCSLMALFPLGCS